MNSKPVDSAYGVKLCSEKVPDNATDHVSKADICQIRDQLIGKAVIEIQTTARIGAFQQREVVAVRRIEHLLNRVKRLL